MGWKRRVDADAAFNSVEINARPLVSFNIFPAHSSADAFGIRDVTNAAICCDSAYFLAVCQTAGISGVLDALAAANSFCMSPQFWSGQLLQPSPSSLQRVASAVRIAGIIRPLIQRYGRTARFPPELLFALLSSSADACLVHWACSGLADMNVLQPGIWHPIAHLPLPKAEPSQDPGFIKRLFSRASRVAPAVETSRGPAGASLGLSMTFPDAAARCQVSHRLPLSIESLWWVFVRHFVLF